MNANKRKLVEHLRLFALNPDYLIPLTKDAIPKTAIGKIQR